MFLSKLTQLGARAVSAVRAPSSSARAMSAITFSEFGAPARVCEYVTHGISPWMMPIHASSPTSLCELITSLSLFLVDAQYLQHGCSHYRS